MLADSVGSHQRRTRQPHWHCGDTALHLNGLPPVKAAHRIEALGVQLKEPTDAIGVASCLLSSMPALCQAAMPRIGVDRRRGGAALTLGMRRVSRVCTRRAVLAAVL